MLTLFILFLFSVTFYYGKNLSMEDRPKGSTGMLCFMSYTLSPIFFSTLNCLVGQFSCVAFKVEREDFFTETHVRTPELAVSLNNPCLISGTSL